MKDIVLPGHPLEPHAQRHQARMLTAETERLAVLLAVVKQVPLVAFQHRARYVAWLGKATVLTPAEKEPNVYVAVAHGVFGVAACPKRFQVFVHKGRQRV